MITCRGLRKVIFHAGGDAVMPVGGLPKGGTARDVVARAERSVVRTLHSSCFFLALWSSRS